MSSVQLDWGTLATIAIGLVCGFWALTKLLLRQFKQLLNTKFENVEVALNAQKTQQAKEYEAINKRLDAQDEADRELQRQIMQSELTREREFTRRDDFNRVIATFQVNVDQLRLYIQRLVERTTAPKGEDK